MSMYGILKLIIKVMALLSALMHVVILISSVVLR